MQPLAPPCTRQQRGPRAHHATATPAAGPLAAISYAWDWGAVVVGVVLLQQLGGLPWRHVRLKIMGAVFVFSALLLALLR